MLYLSNDNWLHEHLSGSEKPFCFLLMHAKFFYTFKPDILWSKLDIYGLFPPPKNIYNKYIITTIAVKIQAIVNNICDFHTMANSENRYSNNTLL